MSSAEQSLAQLASPAVQQQIAAAGGALPNLAGAAKAAEEKALKDVLDQAIGAATDILKGATAKAGTLVAEGNELQRKVDANAKEVTKLTRARAYFGETNNIYPLRKLCGLPTPASILAQYPKIDEIPDGWTAAATTPAAAG